MRVSRAGVAALDRDQSAVESFKFARIRQWLFIQDGQGGEVLIIGS